MDIQGYILDHWQAKMKPETPVIIIYDKEGVYYDLLPIAIEKGFKVIDTTKGCLFYEECLHISIWSTRYL